MAADLISPRIAWARLRPRSFHQPLPLMFATGLSVRRIILAQARSCTPEAPWVAVEGQPSEFFFRRHKGEPAQSHSSLVRCWSNSVLVDQPGLEQRAYARVHRALRTMSRLAGLNGRV
jgi:hypothetical protein